MIEIRRGKKYMKQFSFILNLRRFRLSVKILQCFEKYKKDKIIINYANIRNVNVE